MSNKSTATSLVLFLFCLLYQDISFATPGAMLEKSATYALGSQVKSFQVPVVDSVGKIKYYDMSITLTINDYGTTSPVADVIATPSPSVTTKVLVPGTYKSLSGTTSCTVTNITLTSGRIQSFLDSH